MNPINEGWDLRMSLAYARALTGLSMSTVSKYRGRQKVSKYQYNLFAYANPELAICNPDVQYKLDNLKGKAFVHNDILYISEVATRQEITAGNNASIVGKVKVKHNRKNRA